MTSPLMNKLFTWLIGLGNPLWSRLGADPVAIRLIVTAKLIMDDRSGVVMGRRQQKQKGMEWFLYIMLLLFGGFMVILPVFMADTASAVGLVLSIMMIYIGLLLVTEMSENMFDQRDVYVLLSRPISDLTLSLARILHIAAFSSKFALCLGGPTAIYLAVTAGPVAFLVYFFLSLLAIAIIMTGTLVGYLVLLSRIPKERLKKVMGWFQMAITFIFFFAYQIPNLFGGDFDALGPLKLVGEVWGFLFPGLWLGGLYKILTGSGFGVLTIGQAVLALAAAIGGGWFYVRQSRGYIKNMLDLREAGSGGGATTGGTATVVGSSPWRDRLAVWLTKPNLGRVSFRFHWNMMLRDMGFKQRTYPSMIYLPVLIMIIALKDAWEEGEVALGQGTVFMLFYFIAWIIIIPLGQVKISDDYRASWIFFATGNAHPEQLHYGQLVAVLGMFFIPTALLIYPAVLIIWGPHLWLDVLFSMGNVLLATLIYHTMDKDPPFGRSKEDSKFSNLGPMLLVSLTASVLGGLHYFLSDWRLLIIAGTVAVWAAVLFWLRSMRK